MVIENISHPDPLFSDTPRAHVGTFRDVHREINESFQTMKRGRAEEESATCDESGSLEKPGDSLSA